jgi:hypothetical protein
MAPKNFKNPFLLSVHLSAFAMDAKWYLCEVGSEAFVSSVD